MLQHRRVARPAKAVILVIAFLTLAVGTPHALRAQVDEYPAADGAIYIRPFTGAGVQLEYRGAVVHVDPWSRADYSDARPADVILVTDTPADHLDPDLIAALRTTRTTVILPSTPEDARDEGGARRLDAVPGGVVMRNGDRRLLRGGEDGRIEVTVEAVPMYDLIPGEPFHAKGEGNGYVLTLGGVRVYLSGVTECTPEMRAVEDVDVLFVPMNLPNGRMPPSAAAECTKVLSPSVVYPYHYRERPIDDFVEAMRSTGVEVRVHDWYPPA